MLALGCACGGDEENGDVGMFSEDFSHTSLQP